MNLCYPCAVLLCVLCENNFVCFVVKKRKKHKEHEGKHEVCKGQSVQTPFNPCIPCAVLLCVLCENNFVCFVVKKEKTTKNKSGTVPTLHFHATRPPCKGERDYQADSNKMCSSESGLRRLRCKISIPTTFPFRL